MNTQFKLRASAGGKLATNPKGKTNAEKYVDAVNNLSALKEKLFSFKDQNCKSAVEIRNEKIPQCIKLVEELSAIKDKIILSESAISHIKDYLTTEIYGYQKEIKSKYIEKGNLLEDAAIDYAIQVLDLPFVLKNETHYMDEHFIGTPDIVADDEVIDIKCSWDCFTFPLFETEVPNDDYFYQLQIYMHLTGKRKARLVYVLMDTPEHMHWERAMTYGHLDEKYRLKSFSIDYDSELITMLQMRVMAAREYIAKELLPLL